MPFPEGHRFGHNLGCERVHDPITFAADFPRFEQGVQGFGDAPAVDLHAAGERIDGVAARRPRFVNAEKHNLIDELLIGRHAGERAEKLSWIVWHPRHPVFDVSHSGSP